MDEELKKRPILSVIKKKPGASPEDAQRKDAPVLESKVISFGKRAEDEEKPFFEQVLQKGARKLLEAAIENQVIDYIQFHKDRRDENGQRLVVHNGHLPEREIVSGIAPIKVRQPQVRHRDQGRFTSAQPLGSKNGSIHICFGIRSSLF